MRSRNARCESAGPDYGRCPRQGHAAGAVFVAGQMRRDGPAPVRRVFGAAAIGRRTLDGRQAVGEIDASSRRVVAEAPRNVAGQSWLVNADCDAVSFQSLPQRARIRADGGIRAAWEAALEGRVLHPDQFADQLRENRATGGNGWSRPCPAAPREATYDVNSGFIHLFRCPRRLL